MRSCAGTEIIKSSSKEHRCDWCGEGIEVGKSYFRQRVFDYGCAYTNRLHPECHLDFLDLSRAQGGGWCEWTQHGMERGHRREAP